MIFLKDNKLSKAVKRIDSDYAKAVIAASRWPVDIEYRLVKKAKLKRNEDLLKSIARELA